MCKNVSLKFNALVRVVPGLFFSVLLAGCGGSGSAPATPAPAATAAAAADDARAAALNAREQELARREAEVAAKEQERETARQQAEETARLEREAAESAAAAKKAARAKPLPSKGASPAKPVTAAAKPTPRPPVPVAIKVPAGTQLTVALSSDLSSKTATPGDPFEARLVSDLTVDNRVAAPAGSRVTGTITDVISGSNAIGATPMLGLKFNHLELADGQRIPINGEINEEGKSEKVQDSAKILGGVAAGAVLGHQVKTNNSGKIIGGLLGGVIGAVAAKKTGSEVQLAAGSTLTIALGEGFTVYHP
jgi:hypothetical protein